MTLLVMAAGMGSRYGGLKQIDPISDHGEVILDFSVFDARRAGFDKTVLVIKEENRDLFEETVGNRLRAGGVNVQYAYQSLPDLPGGVTPPPDRVKPWGTVQAVLAARDLIREPFAVINADDFYGADAFRVLANALHDPDSNHHAMVGYQLGNTLTDYGSVARGVCRVENGLLAEIEERTHIVKRGGAAAYSEDNGATFAPLALDTPVSMQCFGFQAGFMDILADYFGRFLQNPATDLQKGECFLPLCVGDMIRAGKGQVRVLQSKDKWFGVTHAKDKPAVVASIQALRDAGKYPPTLW